ncbi:hypothetical protein [Methanosphaera sp. WGK6]|uniref:hypothetical protein n=1 Tax=Methanosphaera sp. WGK6 TaxID=1561964 RepID=UPI0018E94993|nr:hypothetical protein [Methanosphaera sp. WGK6]
MHGFYIYEEENIVSFDLIVDFEADREQVKLEIINQLKEKHPDYQYMIVDDYDISD